MEDLQDKFLEEIISDIPLGGFSLPQYVISGSGWGWFLDPEAHAMVRINRGTEIIPLGDDSDSQERLLVRAPYRFLLIPEKEVQEIGWN